MSTQRALPVDLSERSDILDVLRGFALLGIFLDNIFGFSGYGFFTPPQREALSTWPVDRILGFSELAFVKGKFYSLFSLLFGIGFSIILIRNEQKGINPLKILQEIVYSLTDWCSTFIFFMGRRYSLVVCTGWFTVTTI